MEYSEFLSNKSFNDVSSGFDIDADDISDKLFEFQKNIVKWALKMGRFAIFADTGLGKTAMQATWAEHVLKETSGSILIFAPLAVAHQTVEEGKKFDVDITYCRSQDDVTKKGIYITNYEMIDRFDLDLFSGLVLDESSILKSQTGKYRTQLIERSQQVPYRLSCTATPSPNDFIELGNQCEFLGVMNQSEMLAMFFVNDTGNTGTWRLKSHAQSKFWEWMATWSCVIRNPRDLGFNGDQYDLPPLNFIDHVVSSKKEGDLFAKQAMTLTERRKAKKETLEERCELAAEIVNTSNDDWIVWCNLNDEQKILNQLIDRDKVSVQGADKDKDKEERLLKFAHGGSPILISKSSIAGFGLNLQHTNNMIFVSMDDSFERFYQAVRRQYRFGQTKEVNVHMVTAESEGAVKANIQRKQKQHNEISENMVAHMREIMKQKISGFKRSKAEYNPIKPMELPIWINKN